MDYANWYKRISQPFRHEGTRRVLGKADRALVYGYVGAYGATLAALAVTRDKSPLKAILVPASTFLLATALRAAVNRPRPYEAHEIDPLVHKDTKGKSLPSRHMASAVAIALAGFQLNRTWGTALSAGCLGVAFMRIVGGVHYPADIAAAAALSLVCAAAGQIVPPRHAS